MKHELRDHSIRSFSGIVPQIGERVFIDRSSIIIGDVIIGNDSSVWPFVIIRGDMHFIRIGARTSIQDGTVCHITHAGPYNQQGWPLTVGDDCTIAHNVTLHGCAIGNRVLVGMGSIVMDGAIIDDDVVVAANSLVPPGKHLVSGYLYMGSPAKPIRPLTEIEMAYFTYSATNYCNLKDRYLNENDN